MLSDEQAKEIEELAGLFFSIEEVEEITGTTNTTKEWKQAFRKGSLLAEAELRRYIISLARDGSSPAQTLAWKMLEYQKRTIN